MLLYHDKISSVSIHGRTFTINEDGFFDVPDDIAGELIGAFGFAFDGAGAPDDTDYTGQRPKYLAHWKIEDLQLEVERLNIKGAQTRKQLIEAIKAARLQDGEGGQ